MQGSHKRVQSTNDSSILSKHSMVKAGYYDDDFLKYFVTKDARRAPLINRGYYIRMKAVNQILETFVESTSISKRQVLSLGAGFDTSFFRLKSQGLLQHTVFFEVDFPEVVKHKVDFIQQHHLLSDTVGAQQPSEVPGFHADGYSLIGCDLKDLPALEKRLIDCGLDTGCPTLLLSEVVLSYLDPISSSAVVRWAAGLFPSAIFVSYEQVYPDDPFGIVMMKHFNHLGSPLRSIRTYSTPEAQVNRYKEQMWPMVRYHDMNSFYNGLPADERQRIDRIEPFDEFEEWHLKCHHYILLAAFKGCCEAIAGQMFGELPKVRQHVALTEKMSPMLLPVRGGDKLKRYGHCAVVLSNGKMVVIGGFGLNGSKHMRLPGVHLLSQAQGSWQCEEAGIATGANNIGSRMFHTMTLLDDDVILVHGGRTSPYKPCTSTVLISLQSNALESCINGSPGTNNADASPRDVDRFTCTVVDCQGTGPSPRWRHTATRISYENGKDGVLCYGGRTLSEPALNDCYILDTKQFLWRKVDLAAEPLECRHSHTTTPWGEYRVVVFGGVGLDSTPISSLQILNTQSMTVEQLDPSPPLPRRYSHTAHVCNNNLIIIGGVNQDSVDTPEITVLNLPSLTWKSYSLPVCPSTSPLMLHNHCSVEVGQQRLMVFGGGGNCFSFGTHLNSDCLVLEKTLLTS